MVKEKKDRRIRKTENQLRAGLAKLLKKKNIREITVKELVEEVDINRSTFYLHYTDIYNMMSTIEEELMKDFRQVIADHPEVDLECENAAYVKEIFSVLEKNREICQALMGEHGDMAFVYRLEELIAEHSVRLFKIQHPKMVDELQYAYTFCLFGCIGMIKKWLDEDSDQTVEEMAAITDNLLRGVKNACV